MLLPFSYWSSDSRAENIMVQPQAQFNVMLQTQVVFRIAIKYSAILIWPAVRVAYTCELSGACPGSTITVCPGAIPA